MDAYTPFPVPDLADALGFRKTNVPLVDASRRPPGRAVGLSVAVLDHVIAYPVNVGGRPLHSWPSFIVVTFEMTVLFAGLAALFGMLGLNGLPMPFHPVFNVERFAFASRDRFFLCIEATDPRFDLQNTRQFLRDPNRHFVEEVPNS